MGFSHYPQVNLSASGNTLVRCPIHLEAFAGFQEKAAIESTFSFFCPKRFRKPRVVWGALQPLCHFDSNSKRVWTCNTASIGCRAFGNHERLVYSTCVPLLKLNDTFPVSHQRQKTHTFSPTHMEVHGPLFSEMIISCLPTGSVQQTN